MWRGRWRARAADNACTSTGGAADTALVALDLEHAPVVTTLPSLRLPAAPHRVSVCSGDAPAPPALIAGAGRVLPPPPCLPPPASLVQIQSPHVTLHCTCNARTRSTHRIPPPPRQAPRTRISPGTSRRLRCRCRRKPAHRTASLRSPPSRNNATICGVLHPAVHGCSPELQCQRERAVHHHSAAAICWQRLLPL